MKNVTMGLLFLLVSGSVFAETRSSDQITIHDLNKTLELCKSMASTGLKVYCADAAKACAGETTYETKRTCLERQAK